MIYFATPSTAPIRARMAAGELGIIATPDSARPSQHVEGCAWIADNGAFNNPKFSETRWYGWLRRRVNKVASCVFATAPDVVGDAAATLQRSTPWLPRIRGLGYPVAFAAQDGVQHTNVPWDEFDALFIGGTTAFKLGAQARLIAAEAKDRGKWLHVGRVSSLRRYRFCEAIKADSCDGTFLTFGPDRRLPELLSWINHPQHAFDLDIV